MRAAAEGAESWRRKYFDTLGRLEHEEGRWTALEASLRRLVTRLCVAAEGIDGSLDRQLTTLSDCMRRRAGEDELEEIFEPLSRAIAALDAAKAAEEPPKPAAPPTTTSRLLAPFAAMATAVMPALSQQAAAPARSAGTSTLHTLKVTPADAAPPAQAPIAATIAVAAAAESTTATAAPSPAEAIFGDERVREVLSRLLDELRRDGSLANEAVSIEERLEVSLTREQLPAVLADTAQLINRRIAGLQREKREVEELLCQVTSRLDEFTVYLTGEASDRKLSLESTHELNLRVVAEMRDLGTQVTDVDVGQVQQLVQARLQAITTHLQEHRSREETRVNSHWERSEKMRQRVERLEQEARDLHDRLRDEQRLALVDSLTQIPNRLAYDQRMEEELKRFRRFGGNVCVVAYDIDRFKGINDAYGHKAGDKVLRVVADTFAERIRETDFIARYGGEEFVALLSGATLEEGMRVVDEMRMAIERLGFHFRGNPVSVTISCGVTLLREGDTADDAFERADRALYQAKQEGRNRCLPG